MRGQVLLLVPAIQSMGLSVSPSWALVSPLVGHDSWVCVDQVLAAGGGVLGRFPYLTIFHRRVRMVNTLVTPWSLHGW